MMMLVVMVAPCSTCLPKTKILDIRDEAMADSFLRGATPYSAQGSITTPPGCGSSKQRNLVRLRS